MIDKLYKSLPFDFVNSKHFVLLLKEVNQIIWPDSSITLYVHVEHVYEQLKQFETSMKVQQLLLNTSTYLILGKLFLKNNSFFSLFPKKKICSF